MRITRIESQKKNPTRKSIYADGAYVAGVSEETLLRAALRTGDEITVERLKTLVKLEETSSAKRVALRFLAHRPRTKKEVRDKLREKEFGEDDINSTLDSLQRAGLIDDAEFTRMYIRDALAARATGKVLLKRKLLMMGVDKAIIDDALQETLNGVDEEASALEAGRKFLKRSAIPRSAIERGKLRNRLASFLGRRGFQWSTIQPVVNELLKEHE
jgi:regulatory protein